MAKIDNRYELLRLEFVKRFSREKLETITIDEYSLNKENNALSRESFCYWVETKLRDIGSIKGGTSFKFGTYVGREGNDLANKRRWTGWTSESFDTIRSALIELYDAGESEDIETIKESKLAPNFRGKLLSIYFPNRYLNIFAKWHLHHFLNKLSIPYNDEDDQVILREKLIAYRDANPMFSEMTALEFGHELYLKYGRPTQEEVQDESSEDLYEHSQQIRINNSFNKVPKFKDEPEERPEQIDSSYGKVYKIDPAKSRRAIIDANYTCEADIKHESFIRKNSDTKYTEAHHLIPRSQQKDFEKSLDVPANIISLCSDCHNCLHYGNDPDGILKKLYDERIDRLKATGLNISFEQLKSYY
jgi:hypothetical protein